jgi:nucleotide-binding universal stress UspA family protein
MLRLLAALDFGDCSREALRAAVRIAQHAPATELTVLTVLESLGAQEAQSESALGEMERAVSALHDMMESTLSALALGALPSGIRVHYTATRSRTPADEIIHQALSNHVDAIVMGTHGRTGIDRLITGSVAEKVVRHAPCSVLIVKPKKTA